MVVGVQRPVAGELGHGAVAEQEEVEHLDRRGDPDLGQVARHGGVGQPAAQAVPDRSRSAARDAITIVFSWGSEFAYQTWTCGKTDWMLLRMPRMSSTDRPYSGSQVESRPPGRSRREQCGEVVAGVERGVAPETRVGRVREDQVVGLVGGGDVALGVDDPRSDAGVLRARRG